MKISACFGPQDRNSVGITDKMIDAMCLYETQKKEAFFVGLGAIGMVTTSDRFSSVSMARKNKNGSVLLVSGTPLDLKGSLDERLTRIISGNFSDAARELKELDGAFAALFWDQFEKKLVVVTDPLGLQPLYISQNRKGFLIASEIKAFPASRMVDIDMDPAGWGTFLALGHTVGDRTQLNGVFRFPPATSMIFDPLTGSKTSEVYWKWPSFRHKMTMDDIDSHSIIQILRDELNAYNQHKKGGTLLLSGGFDSRLTLAMLHQEKRNPSVLILGHQDELWGADSKIALSVVKRLGVTHKLIKTPRDFYRTPSYLDYLVANEVATPSLYLFISQVSTYIDPVTEVIWDGTPPGYGLVPAFLPPGGFDVFLKHSFKPRNAFIWQMAEQTFGRESANLMYEEASVAIQNEIQKYPDNEMGVTMFEVYNRMRNRTAPNALKVYANKALPCMLGVSRYFWDAVGQIPYNLTKNYNLYFEIFRRHFPNIANIPFLSGIGLWCDRSCGLRGIATKIAYHIAKARFTRLSQKAYWRYIRGSRRYWIDSQFLIKTRERLTLDHPDLYADGIRHMDTDRRLPFYWQMWRWIMSGELTTWNSDVFLNK